MSINDRKSVATFVTTGRQGQNDPVWPGGAATPMATDPSNPTWSLVGGSTYGKIPQVQPYNLTVQSEVGSAAFGVISSAGLPCNVQLALKLSF